MPAHEDHLRPAVVAHATADHIAALSGFALAPRDVGVTSARKGTPPGFIASQMRLPSCITMTPARCFVTLAGSATVANAIPTYPEVLCRQTAGMRTL